MFVIVTALLPSHCTVSHRSTILSPTDPLYCLPQIHYTVSHRSTILSPTDPLYCLPQIHYTVSYRSTILSPTDPLYCLPQIRSTILSPTDPLYCLPQIHYTVSYRSTILTVLVPTAYAHTLESPYIVNSVGFIVTSMLQITLTYLLILALDHERRFRSPGQRSNRGSRLSTGWVWDRAAQLFSNNCWQCMCSNCQTMGKWHETHGQMPLSHGLTTIVCSLLRAYPP